VCNCAAVRWLDPGVDIRAVADLLGHNSIKRAYRDPSDIAHVAVIAERANGPNCWRTCLSSTQVTGWSMPSSATPSCSTTATGSGRCGISTSSTRVREPCIARIKSIAATPYNPTEPQISAGSSSLRRTPAHRSAAAPAAAHRLVGTLWPTGTPDRLGGRSPEMHKTRSDTAQSGFLCVGLTGFEPATT
jgi:hypothetical protein